MKNKAPLYSLDQKVFHRRAGVWGVVTRVFEEGDSWRYYVQHSEYTFSVPEHGLSTVPPPPKIIPSARASNIDSVKPRNYRRWFSFFS